MHKAFLAAGIIFALDALFVLCNFCYVRRVFSHALDTLEQSQDDALVDEYLVPHAPTIEPMDLRATSVMGALPINHSLSVPLHRVIRVFRVAYLRPFPRPHMSHGLPLDRAHVFFLSSTRFDM